MSFFDQVYHKLFPHKEFTPKILVHERIERSTKYKSKYETWRHSAAHFDLLKAVAQSYGLKKHQKEEGIPNVHILNTGTSDGFAISYDTSYTALEYQFLLDWFSEKAQQLDYLLYNSDVTITEKAGKVETMEKHYLKPQRDKKQESPDDNFGNILIEYIKVDDAPSYLRLSANTFPDRVNKKPENFDNLAEFLFKF